MSQRYTTKVALGPNRVRYRTRVLGEECPPGSQAARTQQALFHMSFVDNPMLLYCGMSIYDRLAIFHNGTSWEANAEAEVDEHTDDA